MDEKRALQLINNLLSSICDCTDIEKNQYEPWLKLEVGFTEAEIKYLKTKNLFPVPV